MTLDSPSAAWRDAEAAAHAAERAVVAEALRFLGGNGAAPSQAQWDESRRLRALADARFDSVLVARSMSKGWPPAGNL